MSTNTKAMKLSNLAEELLKKGVNEEAIEAINGKLKKFFKENPDWSLFIITPDEEFEDKVMGRKADRRRKLFNGRLKTCYYQFHGKRVF